MKCNVDAARNGMFKGNAHGFMGVFSSFIDIVLTLKSEFMSFILPIQFVVVRG